MSASIDKNTPVHDEEMSYHALAIALEGKYESIKKLLAEHRTAAAAWRAQKSKISREELWKKLESLHVSLLLEKNEAFPQLLREMPWPPFALYIKGAPLREEEIRVAIVGTRRATPDGRLLAREFAKVFARKGAAVVSGLALGIDGEAHEGALEAHGKTIAVLPCGLDRVYPREHDRLAEKILSSGGTLISEYPPGSASYPSRFIERNRIVSALSAGVLIIEAPEKSGALATARFALEQNRAVFVVPGPVKHPNYAGSHALIRDGAELVRSPEDVLQALGVENSREDKKAFTIPAALDEKKKAILNCLNVHGGALAPDEIAQGTALDIKTVQREIAYLVIDETIKEKPDGTYTLNL